jgi:predicted phosphatase
MGPIHAIQTSQVQPISQAKGRSGGRERADPGQGPAVVVDLHEAAVAASPPFTKVNQDTVQTSDGTQFQLFEGVREVIEYLLARPTEYTVRIASASQASTCAKQLLSMFGFPQRLTRGAQIYSANKIKHLTTIGKETNIPLRSKCVFFDDLKMFATQAESIGITTQLVDPNIGVTMNKLHKGLAKLKSKNSSSNFMTQWTSKGKDSASRSATSSTTTNSTNSGIKRKMPSSTPFFFKNRGIKKHQSKRQQPTNTSRFSKCPICSTSVPTARIQNHVEKCLLTSDRNEQTKETMSKEIAIIHAHRKKATAPVARFQDRATFFPRLETLCTVNDYIKFVFLKLIHIPKIFCAVINDEVCS